MASQQRSVWQVLGPKALYAAAVAGSVVGTEADHQLLSEFADLSKARSESESALAVASRALASPPSLGARGCLR
jgi:hypothetical protein